MLINNLFFIVDFSGRSSLAKNKYFVNFNFLIAIRIFLFENSTMILKLP